MNSRANKDKGYRWEKMLEVALQAIWPEARRTGAARAQYADFEGTGDWLVEAKDEQTITLSKYMDQVTGASNRLAADHGEAAWPVALVKRRRRSVEEAYAVMELRTWVECCRELEAIRAELDAVLDERDAALSEAQS